MLKDNRFDVANNHVLKMLESTVFPLPRIFRFYLNRTAETGNYSVLETISKSISSDLKKLLSFDNRLCTAYAVAGKSEEYLMRFENKLSNATTPEDLKSLEEEFPRGGAIGILEKQPELIEKCK